MMGQKHSFPIFVYPTLHCNFSCSYCFNRSGPAEATGSFLLDHWENLLTACAALAVPEIRVSGGEPLLIADLEERCRAIVDRGMRYTLLTNGSLIDRHVGWLSEAPPETLWISYHHEFSSANAFERHVATAAKGVPCVGVHVFSSDIEREPELVSRAVHAGAQRIKILSLTNIGRCADDHHTEKLSAVEIDAMALGWKRLTTKTLEVRIAAPASFDWTVGEDTCVLRARPLISINHDGSVYPCCVTLGSGSAVLGSLQHETMETIICRANSTSRQLPCKKLLPLISSNQSCCPLRLVSLPIQSQGMTTAG